MFVQIIHWKLCKISLLRKLVSKKLVSECNVCNMELPSWFSESWWHISFQMKRVSKWLLGLYYVLMIIGKLCRWILPMKIESYIWLMIEPKCYWVRCRKRWICNERFQNWMLVQLVTRAWMGDFSNNSINNNFLLSCCFLAPPEQLMS